MTKLFPLGVLLSALIATPAASQVAPGEANRVVVSAAGLDLATSDGQRKLDRRLAQAVIQVCGLVSDIDLAGKNEIGRCRAETSASIAASRDRLVQLASRGSEIVLASR